MTPFIDGTSLFSTLVIPYALVLAVPGPNVLVVSSAGLQSRVIALTVAVGVATGVASVAALASAGANILPNLAFTHVVGCVVFSLLLLRSAAQLLRISPQNADLLPTQPTRTSASAFMAGFGVAALNPLTIPFFLGLFVTHPLLTQAKAAAAACCITFAMALVWYVLIALTVSRSAETLRRRSGQAVVRIPVALALVAIAVTTVSPLVGM